MNHPTLQEEVERKAFETVEKLYLDQKTKRITEAQYQYGLDILWSAVAGLASKDIMLMLETARSSKKDGSFFTREYYLSDKGHIVKLSNLHDGRVRFELTMYGGITKLEKTYDLREEANPFVAAREKFQELSDNLISRGFQEI